MLITNGRRQEVENVESKYQKNKAQGLLLTESYPDTLAYQSTLQEQYFLSSLPDLFFFLELTTL